MSYPRIAMRLTLSIEAAIHRELLTLAERKHLPLTTLCTEILSCYVADQRERERLCDPCRHTASNVVEWD